ncbi:hypothetical protein F7230_00840 [Corynebacterium sp. 320]|uniref:hypothetical protein n=1 Tax=Corynebacterium TaxID=1716 RepID=UPI00125CC24D|nr:MULTISPECIES: hypothetical protein [Corynebacterium]KAB1503709.1 hypothetical protein F7230_00840 [Corynebacterium sp. 320]KAB1553190.1 hypothetical protein F7233_05750 [Corynebacterium sp. 321]KAB1553591.1 hypothetical protein F7232_00835 [Corynebacterium sp. 319]KAB3527845.1 hypothetical protein F8354_00840 [Corynebacterium sp. 250]KAB3540666.1 hypothetical protein F8390_05495 [Corynebacterium sp. 366]
MHGDVLSVGIAALISGLVVAAAIVDAATMRLPNALVLLLGALVLLGCVAPWYPVLSLSHLWGGVVWGVFPILMNALSSTRMVAAGDSKFAVSLGTLAVMHKPWGLLVAMGIAGLVTLAWIALGRARRSRPHEQTRVPHGPGMAVGTLCAIVMGW